MSNDVDGTSFSATGALLGRLADGLEGDLSALKGASANLGEEWVGPRSVAARRRLDTVAANAARLGSAAAGAGAAFQGLAIELADIEARTARITARAAVAGLVVEDGIVRHRATLRSVADPATEAGLERTRAQLESELQALESLRAGAVRALLAVLDPSALERIAQDCRR